MKPLLTITLFSLVFLTFQACGSLPQQTASHIGNSGDRFESGTFAQPFDHEAELIPSFGASKSKAETEGESSFDKQNEAGTGIIFMPVTIQSGFTVTWRMLRFCERLYNNPCTHLRVQAGEPTGFPKAPVSLPDGRD